jgi:Ca2+-binding RTX toxin-like protein
LLITTYGTTPYTAEDLAANPALLDLDPTIVSKFEVTPTSDSIIGTARGDDLHGTSSADVILGAAGKDYLRGRDGDDYLDGGQDADAVDGGMGADRIFGRGGNDELNGQLGDDEIDGGIGNDVMTSGGGSDTFLFAPDFGRDRINDFDADPSGGQDFLDISEFGITSADFTSRVSIAGRGADTLITIDADQDQTIRLVGIRNAATVTEADFIL